MNLYYLDMRSGWGYIGLRFLLVVQGPSFRIPKPIPWRFWCFWGFRVAILVFWAWWSLRFGAFLDLTWCYPVGVGVQFLRVFGLGGLGHCPWIQT